MHNMWTYNFSTNETHKISYSKCWKYNIIHHTKTYIHAPLGVMANPHKQFCNSVHKHVKNPTAFILKCGGNPHKTTLLTDAVKC